MIITWDIMIGMAILGFVGFFISRSLHKMDRDLEETYKVDINNLFT